jgi:L-rhamnose isomerase
MVTFDQITGDLDRQAIELPSWAFGNSGTRFKVFAQPGVPRDPFEMVADAAQVHAQTGLAPSVALHIPWDRVDDFDKLRRHVQTSVCAWGQSTPTPSRTTTTCSAVSATSTTASGPRRSAMRSTAWTSWM